MRALLALVAIAATPVAGWVTGQPISHPPRVTVARVSSAAGYTSPASPVFRYFGAHPTWKSRTIYPDKLFYAPDNVTGRYEAPPWFVTFRSTGPFTIFTKGMGGRYRLLVDNHPATVKPQRGPPANGGGYALAVAIKGTHTIVVEMDGLFYFGGVKGNVSRSPLKLGKRILFYGDSITEGEGADASFDGYAVLTGFRLGYADTWQSGSGGTGYLVSGPAGRFTLEQRFATDVKRYHPNVLVLAGGHNDLGRSPAQIAAVAKRLIAACGCKTYLLSPFDGGTGDSASYADMNAALAQVAADTGATFIDVTGWKYPTVDGTHPTQAGHSTIAQLLSQAISRS